MFHNGGQASEGTKTEYWTARVSSCWVITPWSHQETSSPTF